MLKLAALIVCLLSTAWAFPRLNASLPLPDGRIVGGHSTDISRHPWQISLQYYYQHFCGGVLISSTWVLTAAHCITEGYSTNLNILAGSTSRSSGGQTALVTRILLHAQWGTNSMEYDIAALQLGSPITISSARAAVLPAESYTVPSGAAVSVTGWGATQEDGASSSNLLEVIVPAIDLTSCWNIYAPLFGSNAITTRQFCAGEIGIGGKDACQGDSGGPAVVNGVVVGLVSWGLGCARAQYPGVYADLASFRNWILTNTGV